MLHHPRPPLTPYQKAWLAEEARTKRELEKEIDRWANKVIGWGVVVLLLLVLLGSVGCSHSKDVETSRVPVQKVSGLAPGAQVCFGTISRRSWVKHAGLWEYLVVRHRGDRAEIGAWWGGHYFYSRETRQVGEYVCIVWEQQKTEDFRFHQPSSWPQHKTAETDPSHRLWLEDAIKKSLELKAGEGDRATTDD